MLSQFSQYKKANSKQKIHQINEQNIEDIDHIDDNRANSEESVSVLRWSSGANIDHSVYLVFEKDKLNYSQYISLKHENLSDFMWAIQ